MEAVEQLTEPQAWREIARRIEAGEWDEIGLCVEIGKLRSEAMISYDTWNAMHTRREQHAAVCGGECQYGCWGQYNWHKGEAGPRVLAAYLLALEAEEEVVADEC